MSKQIEMKRLKGLLSCLFIANWLRKKFEDAKFAASRKATYESIVDEPLGLPIAI